ncbi:MAG: hypothetical protein ABI702_07835 [Burkholderiales bacterium]
MDGITLADVYPRPEWIKRFAYRMMLCRNGLDTASAMIIADFAFDASNERDPEVAAELHSGTPVFRVERRHSPETRRLFGRGRMQGSPDMTVEPPTNAGLLRHPLAAALA